MIGEDTPAVTRENPAGVAPRPARAVTGSGTPRTVGIFVFPGVKLLDVSGPAEVFAEANLFGADYRISIVSVDGEPVVSSTGTLMPDGSADTATAFDILFIAGGDSLPTAPPDPAQTKAVQDLARRAATVASICTGAFLLGAAGLLDGRRATTHWRHTALLARLYPTATVEPDAIYVRDRSLYSSAGVTAGVDLALAILEDDGGPDLARKVAQSLVVYMQRPGGQSQFSASLQGPPPRTPVLKLVTDIINAEPAGDHRIDLLARNAAVSPRHLTRLFRDELDTTPTKYVERIRLDIAKAQLDSGRNATEAAALAGFSSYEALRRAFIRTMSISPIRYQQRFSTAKR